MNKYEDRYHISIQLKHVVDINQLNLHQIVQIAIADWAIFEMEKRIGRRNNKSYLVEDNSLFIVRGQ